MFKKLLFLLACAFINVADAQIKPANGSILNYRIIGFQVPQNNEASTYVLRIALDSVISPEQLDRRKIVEQKAASNRIIETVPDFNTFYTWQVIYKDKHGKEIGSTSLNYFRTGYIKFVDTAYYRMSILKNKMPAKDIYVLLDNSAVMYDLNGKPVWYLPNNTTLDTNMHVMRDLKPTVDGTFTALFEHGIYEFDYYGRVLWSGPMNGASKVEGAQTYHHEFTKLGNGHYMVAGNEVVENELPAELRIADSPDVIKRGGKTYRTSVCGNLLEYDNNGKLLWSWRSSPFFPSVGVLSPGNRMANIGTHMNSFYFNEKDSLIYVGFRNISTIAKIEYPSGYVKETYKGKNTEMGMRREGTDRENTDRNMNVQKQVLSVENEGLFSNQHACRVEKNKVYVFNNNTIRNPNFISYAEIYQEPDTIGKPLRKIWSYPCNIDTFANPGSPTGGSIYPLSDSLLLVCTGGSGRVFIVNLNKELLWNAIPVFKRMDGQTKPLPQYRASFMRKEDFYKFLFK